MVIIDTNIIIDHLRQQNDKDSLLIRIAQKYSKESLAISMLTIQELYEGQSTQNGKKEESMLSTISPLKILPYTFEIAKLAGQIARNLKQPIELADAAIAATSIIHNVDLFTLNQKHFKKITDLELATIN